jgi:uridine kinase
MALTQRLLSYKLPTSALRELAAEAASRLGVHLLEQTPQVRGIYTLLRDRTCSKEDFIFYCDRLSTLLVERAMNELPYRPCEIFTATDEKAAGQQQAAQVQFSD